MRWKKALVLIALLIAPAFAAIAASNNLPSFTTEAQAQQHCPGDRVVWANLSSGVYHLRGERYYGRTKNGAYICQKDAEQNGLRMTRNGQ